MESPSKAYGIIGLAILAKLGRCVIDLGDHPRQVFAHLLKPCRELIGEFIPVPVSLAAAPEP